jgi:hypothetical protein
MFIRGKKKDGIEEKGVCQEHLGLILLAIN